MSTERTDGTIEEFCTRVEEETGKEALPDPSLGDDLGWFMIHSPVEFQGESFVAEFDVNLSEEHVALQWGEIWIDIPDEDREAILDDVASRIDWTEGEEALYEFRASEDHVPGLMQVLRKVHAEVFG